MNISAQDKIASMTETEILELLYALEERALSLGFRNFAPLGSGIPSETQMLIDSKANSNDVVNVDGTNALSSDWITGQKITAEQVASSIAVGTSPFEVVSTTVVSNLNADSVDGVHASAMEPVLTKGNLTGGSNKITIGGTGTGAVIGSGVSVDVAQANLDHGSVGGLGDDDHSQYLLTAGSRALSSDWDVGNGRMIQADKIRARDGDGLALYEDGGSGIFVKDGGNVGIGTVDPGDKFHVNGNIMASSPASPLTDVYMIMARGSNSAVASLIFIPSGTLSSSNVGWYQGMAASSNSWSLSTWWAGEPGTTERLVFTNGFKLGVGFSTPLAKLAINGGLNVGDEADPGDNNLIVQGTITAKSEIKTDGGSLWAGISASDVSMAMFRTTTYGGIQVANWAQSGGVSNLALNPSGGNVGIGTTAPTSKLQVVGLPAYANNAAAVAGGLTAGAFYRTNGDPDLVCVVH